MRIFLLLIIICMSWTGSIAGEIILENSKVAFKFDPEQNFSLQSIYNKDTGRSVYINDKLKNMKAMLWQMNLVDYNKKSIEISGSKANYKIIKTSNGKCLKINWLNIHAGTSRVNVKAEFYLSNNQSIADCKFSAEVTGNKVLWIKELKFPVLRGIKSLGDDYLLVPRYLGRILRNPARRLKNNHLAYPGKWSMQFAAFHGSQNLKANKLVNMSGKFKVNGFVRGTAADETGLFISSTDGKGWHKEIDFSRYKGQNKSFNIYISHFPQLPFWPPQKYKMGNKFTYTIPYSIRMGTFSGGTIKACEIYRKWALKQEWMKRGPIRKPFSPDKNTVSPKTLNCAFWGKFYHGAGKVVPEIAAFREYLKVPTNIHWYRYKISSFDDNNLEYFPLDPYFKKGVTTLCDMNIGVMPYVCCAVWDMDTESWTRKNMSQAAAISDSGYPYLWFLKKQPNAWMNPAAKLWRDEFSAITLKLFEDCGVNGEYLDVMGGASKLCYNDKINKPNGGYYWSQGNRKLLKNLRAKIKKINPEAFLTTEAFSENYIDLLDAFLMLDITRYGWKNKTGYDNFPLVSYVYHDYFIPYGSDCNQLLDAENHRWQMGLSYIWGIQPMYSATKIYKPETTGKVNDIYTREIVRSWYQVGSKFLTGGLGVECALVPDRSLVGLAPVALISPRYAIQSAMLKTKFPWIGPSVLASAWRGVDNTIGITMTNICDKSIDAELIIDRTKLNTTKNVLWQTWPLPVKKIKTITDRFSLTCKVPAAAVRIYELRDNTLPSVKPLEKLNWEFTSAEKNGTFKAVTIENDALYSSKGAIVQNTIAKGKNRLKILSRRTGKTPKVKNINWMSREGYGKPRLSENQPFYLYQKSPYRIKGKAQVKVYASAGNIIYANIKAASRCSLTGPMNAIIIGRKDGQSLFLNKGACSLDKGNYMIMAYVPDKNTAAPTKYLLKFLSLLSMQCAEQATEIMRSKRWLSVEEKKQAEQLYILGNAASLVGAGLKLTNLMDNDWCLPHVLMPLKFKIDMPDSSKIKSTMRSLRSDLDKMLEFTAVNKTDFNLTVLSDAAVENLMPVLYRADVVNNSTSFTLTDVISIEIDRPLIISTPANADTIITSAGAFAKGKLDVRNVSPYNLDLKISAELPIGWSIEYKKTGLTFKLAGLKNMYVPFTIKTTPNAKGDHKVKIYINYCNVKKTRVFEEITVSILPRLVPVMLNSKKRTIIKSPRFRNIGQGAVFVSKNTTLKFRIDVAKLGRLKKKAVAWQVKDDMLKTIRSGKWQPSRKEPAIIKLDKAGIYYLICQGSVWFTEIEEPQFSAFSACEKMPLTIIGNGRSKYKFYFYVPREAKEFFVCGTDGGPGEPAGIVVRSPSGKISLKYSGRWQGSVFSIKVAAQDAGKIWSFILSPKQDMKLYFKGDVTPWISLAKHNTLKIK